MPGTELTSTFVICMSEGEFIPAFTISVSIVIASFVLGMFVKSGLCKIADAQKMTSNKSKNVLLEIQKEQDQDQ